MNDSFWGSQPLPENEFTGTPKTPKRDDNFAA